MESSYLFNKGDYVVFTDGSCRPNPGRGGWAAIIIGSNGMEHCLDGSEPASTNNRMEIMAAIHALNAIRPSSTVKVHTDSAYVKNGITKWIPVWAGKDLKMRWKTATGMHIRNADLWQQLHIATQRHHVDWEWIKGHADNRYNILVDQAAKDARDNRVVNEYAAHTRVSIDVSPYVLNTTLLATYVWMLDRIQNEKGKPHYYLYALKDKSTAPSLFLKVLESVGGKWTYKGSTRRLNAHFEETDFYCYGLVNDDYTGVFG